ncbi:MAG: nucleoside permease [Bacteroidetes bacterium GWF2_38_335]|nr:MAG: nucleoside permease [Bacteroidetes bacterium GWF2_38_335]OFY80677.1 MAG: nucleoside permease [Bacteroidetes bacterium RIFOXYA12_FULL_38_20]HBS87020.1 MFS transporter [Bacteroidales bacterium]
MSVKFRLILMNFLQFFVWGAWLITIANYWFGTKGWGEVEFTTMFMTLGISSIFMPALMGIVADRWINGEKLFGLLHVLSGITIFCLPMIDSTGAFFWVMLIAMCFYMPTISLSNTIAYNALKSGNFDVVKSFPPIRVWGTIGFIAAMWVTNLTGSKANEFQFYISAIASAVLGVYSFTLPKCPPKISSMEKSSFVEKMGLNAFRLFTNYKMALFFVFSILLGAALQLTNMYGDVFLSDFKKIPEYADSFVIEYSTIIMSISQISETLFILAIPFFLRRFGIKKVMLISMVAWVLRFGLFSYGDPHDGLWMIILSCIIYGMAFDFFNISGSLFVETQCDPSIRASSQGLFMMMTNGIGSIIGSLASGFIISEFFMDGENKIWSDIWLTFALYALAVTVLFALLFRHKHNAKDFENFSH